MYQQNYGGAPGGAPQYPGSQASTAPTDDSSWQQEYTEYIDPVQDAKDKLKKIDRKDRRKARKKNDGIFGAQWLIFLGILSCFMWLVPVLLGDSWHTRMFAGFGIGFTQMKVSLFALELQVECHQMEWSFGIDSDAMAMLNPAQQVCLLLKKMEGSNSLHDAKDIACVFGTASCQIMEHLFYSSFFLVFAFGVSALLALVGAMFLWYYWYQEHLAKIRKYAMLLYAASPLLGIIAFCMYSLVSPDIGDLPRAWTTMVSTIASGTGFGSVKAIGTGSIFARHGWSWFFCFFSMGTGVAPMGVWAMFFQKHPDEKEHELAAINEKIAMEDAVEALREQQDQIEQNMFGETPHPQQDQPYAQPGYPQQGAYPPQQGGYPPQQGGYPPQQGGYPPQQGSYPPQMQGQQWG